MKYKHSYLLCDFLLNFLIIFIIPYLVASASE